jgi:hypothetical protein
MGLSVVKYLTFEFIGTRIYKFIDKCLIVILIEFVVGINFLSDIGNSFKSNIKLFLKLAELIILVDVSKISYD